MSTKTLSLPEEVYVRFDAEWRGGESFNDVITRLTDKKTLTNIVESPSIHGMRTSTIVQNQDITVITVQKLYSYPCAGTGGHTESVSISGNEVGERDSWNGYAEDGDTITFDSSFTLEVGKINAHKIETGSYPQIHHTKELQTETGWLNCTKFTDANGKEYKDWIPAIRLWIE